MAGTLRVRKLVGHYDESKDETTMVLVTDDLTSGGQVGVQAAALALAGKDLDWLKTEFEDNTDGTINWNI